MIINVPVYGPVNFPDSMTDEEIEKAIQVNLGLGAPRDIGLAETAARGLERGVTGSIRGGADLLKSAGIDTSAGPEGFEPSDPLTAMMGTPLAPDNQRASLAAPDQKLESDFQRELQFRLAREQNPITGYGSQILGSIGDPINLLPIGRIGTAAQGARQFALAGGIAGALEPVYEEFDDSRFANTAIGAAAGGALGGIVGALIGKFGRQVTDDIMNTGVLTPDGQEIITPHFKLKLNENGEWVQEELPVTEAVVNARKQAAERRETEQLDAASTPEVPNPVVNVAKAVEQDSLPVLPNFLSGASPKFFKSDLEFETDIDKALYIVGNPSSKSARHEDYMSFLEQSLKLNRDEISKLGAQVRKEVVEAGKAAQQQAGITGTKEVPRITFGLSKTVDKLLNPADKYLDDISKRVYNIGAGYKTGPRGYPVLNPKQATEALSVLRRVDPDIEHGLMDASQKVIAYRRYLDDMKALKGREYQPRSFDDFVKKGLGTDDQIRLIDAGSFDGCI